jgi:WD40 repeat protein
VGAPGRGEGLKERAALPAHDEWVQCLAFSPDGKTVATGGRQYDRQSGRSSGELKLWDVQAGKQQTVLHGHTSGVQALAFAPDGKSVATGSGDEAVKVWDLESGTERLSVRARESGTYCLAFSPDGKVLGCAGYPTVRLLDAATGKVLSSFRRPGPGAIPVFSPDWKTFAVANHQDANLYDPATGKERLVLEDHRGGVYRLAFSGDGKTLAVASTRWEYPKTFGEIKLWDPMTGRERAVLKDQINFVRSLALSPDGGLLAVAGSKELTGPNEIKLIDVATGRDLAVVAAPGKDWVSCLAFSPNGRLLAGGIGKTLTLWDVPTTPAGHK